MTFAEVVISLVSGSGGAILVYFLAPLIQRKYLTWRQAINIDGAQGGAVRCSVTNRGIFTVENASLYITLDIRPDDLSRVLPMHQDAFINVGSFVPLDNGQLCWSICEHPKSNPFRIDIRPGEKLTFCPVHIVDDLIVVPSEKGWDDSTKRVYLRAHRKYFGKIKFVSGSTESRSIKIAVDPKNRPFMFIESGTASARRKGSSGSKPRGETLKRPQAAGFESPGAQ